jgi:hypothetical protein
MGHTVTWLRRCLRTSFSSNGLLIAGNPDAPERAMAVIQDFTSNTYPCVVEVIAPLHFRL